MRSLSRHLFAAPMLAAAAFAGGVAVAQDGGRPLPQIVGGSVVCEPSGAVGAQMPDGRRVLVVANDGDNVLRAYEWPPNGVGFPILVLIRREERGNGGAPVAGPDRDLDDFLRIAQGDRGRRRGRADIEAAARSDGLIYWIGSHSRNSDGELRENRHRFFATTGDLRQSTNGTEAVLDAVGSARDLMEALTAERLGLRASIGVDIGVDGSIKLHPKDPGAEVGGLNIEGLARDLNGGGLLIGLRSPPRGGRAIVLPFSNPHEAVADASVAPRIGNPIELELGGRGVRSIEYIQGAPPERRYLIVAGSAGSGDDFTLYRWSGVKEQQPVEVAGAAEVLRRLGQAPDGRGAPLRFGPEALVADGGDSTGKTIHLLSDDGDRRIDGAKADIAC